MERDLSPEERLLALIRGKEKKAANNNVPAKKGDMVIKNAQPGPSAGRLGGLAKIFRNYIFSSAKPVRLRTLALLNRYLAALSAVITLYLILDIYLNPYRNRTVAISKSYGSSAGNYRGGKGLSSQALDYSNYAGVIANRTLFGQPPSSEGPFASAAQVIAADDAAKELGLVGVIAGENPQAIIENRKTQKTYYLNKGDSFDGFIVDEISDGKVLLDREGKKTALFL